MWRVICFGGFGGAGDLALDVGATGGKPKTKSAFYWCERLFARQTGFSAFASGKGAL